MTELITQLFATLNTALLGMVEALKDGFANLIYVDPTALTPEISPLALFGFIMVGLSMGIGLVYTVFKMIKR